MSGETQQILLTFIFLFSGCTFGLFTLSTVGSKWFSCRSVTHGRQSNQYDLIFTLWEYCERTNRGDYLCSSIDDAPQFRDVLLDFQVLRVLTILCCVCSGLVLLTCLSLCALREKKICRRIVIMQSILAILTVILGISSLVYGAARAQDIVGPDVHFTFGWSCVSSWIATIIAFLNAVVTLVLICVYLDRLSERVLQVRENLGMDNLSIRSDSLRRISSESEIQISSSVESTNEVPATQSALESQISSSVEITNEVPATHSALESIDSSSNVEITNEAPTLQSILAYINPPSVIDVHSENVTCDLSIDLNALEDESVAETGGANEQILMTNISNKIAVSDSISQKTEAGDSKITNRLNRV